MRAAAAAAVILALAGSGCFGLGCFPDSYRLVWQQPDLAQAIAARVAAGGDNASLQVAPAPALLAVDAAHLPVADGNASLLSIGMSWGGDWPGSLTLQAGRGEGAPPVLRGTYDTGDRKATVRRHYEDAIAALVDASEAERAAAVDALLAGWDPLSNEVTHRAETAAPGTLRTDAFFAAHGGDWAPEQVGHWWLHDGAWSAHAVVTVWRITTPAGQIEADAAGAVAGPPLDVDGGRDGEAPPMADLQAAARPQFLALELPDPTFDQAQATVFSRICVD